MTTSLLERRPNADILDALTRREFLTGLVAAGLLTACGRPGSNKEGSATREVTDAFGKITIPSRPERIVADSVATYAHLVSLGVIPIGAAIPVDISPEYIGVDRAEVKNLAAEDGWTVNIEAALAMDPDRAGGCG